MMIALPHGDSVTVHFNLKRKRKRKPKPDPKPKPNPDPGPKANLSMLQGTLVIAP